MGFLIKKSDCWIGIIVVYSEKYCDLLVQATVPVTMTANVVMVAGAKACALSSSSGPELSSLGLTEPTHSLTQFPQGCIYVVTVHQIYTINKQKNVIKKCLYLHFQHTKASTMHVFVYETICIHSSWNILNTDPGFFFF